MTKREAKKLALAILGIEDLTSIVDEQVGGANHNFDSFSNADRKRIVDAAEEITQELFNRAGCEATEFVARMPDNKLKRRPR